MFGYYLRLAFRSLKRNRVLTALMIMAIGLGIGASMTMLTVLHVMTNDPIPGRSAHLYTPHLDPLPKNYKGSGFGPVPSENLTYVDAMALLKGHRAQRQAVMAGGSAVLHPARPGLAPFTVYGRYATADFFAMFGVPFAHGQSWSAREDDARAHVVVLSETLSRKLFGTVDSLGQTVRLDDNDFRVIGVTRAWHPQPMFYGDPSIQHYGDADQFFLPLTTAIDRKLSATGNFTGWDKNETAENETTGASTSWLQMWVQLNSPEQARAYRQFLVDYSSEQKKLGRFERSPDEARLYGLMEWLDHENLVPADVRLQSWLAVVFLAVCMTNMMALLLAKFLQRSGEISVRRALGARRRDIFLQLSMESGFIGLAGGVVGLLLAQWGLWSVRSRPDDYARLAHMDMSMLMGAFVLAVVASLLAGLMPAWRACRVMPALQLKLL